MNSPPNPPPGPASNGLRLLFAPAVALMNHLKYPQKFLLISALFLLPLGLVMYLLISEIDERIEFAHKEMLGNQYLRPLRMLYEQVAQSRILAHAYTQGRVGLRPELVRKMTALDEQFESLQAAEQQLGQVLQTAGGYLALQESWRFLKAKLLSLEPQDADDLHTGLLADLHALSARVGDTSNLILDPDLDSYYVMDAVLLKLPQGVSLAAQTRSFGQKNIVLGKAPTAEERAEFTRLAGLLRSNLDDTTNGLGIAFRNNPGTTLKPHLERPLREHAAATEEFLRALDTGVIKARTINVTPDAYDQLAASALTANFALWDQASSDLDDLLRTRNAGFTRKKYLVEAFAVLALLGVSYLLVAFYLAVMRTVGSLREASDRMVGGSIDHAVKLETRDELGQVVTSFNNIAMRLREEWAQAQEESTRARAAETALEQQSALVQLLQRVATAANEAPTPEAALQIAIREVCAYTHWPVGDAFALAADGSGELVCTGVWHLDDVERFGRFRALTEASRFPSGVGLPGRVLASGQPAWIMDVTQDVNFPRAQVVRDCAVRGAFGFPVLTGREVVGVLEFFTPESREPDLTLLQTMAHIGTQLGRVFERQQAETELRQAKEAAELKSEDLEEALQQLKAAQDQLVVKEKLASLGTLTAGIAHEIKNPLNFVTNFAQLSTELVAELGTELALVKDQLGQEVGENLTDLLTTLDQNVARISEHGHRADRIVRDMLAHSRQPSGERQLTDLNALLAQYVGLAYHGMRAQDPSFNVTLETNYDATLPPVSVNPQDLSRVFLNLVNNACYAVHTRKKAQGDGFAPTIAIATCNLGAWVEIRIRDNGNGIPAAKRGQLFQPFFTTKPAGEGTGLGLSISYDIVVQGHQGKIRVETEEGRFAEFIISLPATATA